MNTTDHSEPALTRSELSKEIEARRFQGWRLYCSLSSLYTFYAHLVTLRNFIRRRNPDVSHHSCSRRFIRNLRFGSVKVSVLCKEMEQLKIFLSSLCPHVTLSDRWWSDSHVLHANHTIKGFIWKVLANRLGLLQHTVESIGATVRCYVMIMKYYFEVFVLYLNVTESVNSDTRTFPKMYLFELLAFLLRPSPSRYTSWSSVFSLYVLTVLCSYCTGTNGTSSCTIPSFVST